MNRTKTISLLKFIPALTMAFFTQGCVGIVVRDMQTKAFEPAGVGRMPDIYVVKRIPPAYETPQNENPTTSWLKGNWGQPSHVKQATSPAQGELWTYDFGRKWCGVMPWLFIPIPLLLPLGREHVVFYIRDGRVLKADKTTLSEYQAVAGFGPEGPTAYSKRIY